MEEPRLYEAADRLLARYGGDDLALRAEGRAALRAWVEAALRRPPSPAPDSAEEPGRRIMTKAPPEPPPL